MLTTTPRVRSFRHKGVCRAVAARPNSLWPRIQVLQTTCPLIHYGHAASMGSWAEPDDWTRGWGGEVGPKSEKKDDYRRSISEGSRKGVDGRRTHCHPWLRWATHNVDMLCHSHECICTDSFTWMKPARRTTQSTLTWVMSQSWVHMHRLFYLDEACKTCHSVNLDLSYVTVMSACAQTLLPGWGLQDVPLSQPWPKLCHSHECMCTDSFTWMRPARRTTQSTLT